MSSTNLGKQRDDAAHVGPSALLDAWNKVRALLNERNTCTDRHITPPSNFSTLAVLTSSLRREHAD